VNALPTLSPDFDRTSGIGASEVGAALGLSRFVSPYTLWARKVGLEPDDRATTAAMEWGLRLQDPILAAYADRLGLDFGLHVRRNNVTKRYAAWPRLFATTDGFVYQPLAGMDGGLQRAWCVDAKAPRSADAWGPDGSSEVPPDYYAQAQAQCLVTGLPRCDLAVLFHGSDFRVYPIEADPDRQALMIEALDAWWTTYVDGNTPPPITDYHPSTDATLAAQFGAAGGGDMAATPEVMALVERLALAYLNRKQASDAYDLARQQVEAAMGLYDRLVTPDASVTWTRSKDTTQVAWDKVADGYRIALDGVLAALPPDTLVSWDNLHLTPEGVRAAVDAMPTLYQSTKPGTRRFVVKPASSTED
jgi:putative phage-type endonuclease